MKSLILGTLFTVAIAYQATAQQSLNLQGQLKNADSKVVYLQKFDNKNFKTVDSAIVKQGKFSFASKIELPELYGITTEPTSTPYYIFLDRNPITVALDPAENFRNTTVSGSKLQDEFNAFKTLKNIEISSYLKENPSSLVSAYLLYRNYAYRLTPEEIESNIKLLSPEIQKSTYVKQLYALIAVWNKVKVGKKAPDFAAKTPEGKTLRLSENYAKYTLVDFWAAWCGPCRKENPNVVAAFEKYKNKGFNIIGVSLDKEATAWKKAIEADHLNWLQVSELSYWKSEIAATYGVRAIPANFLLDEKGIIVAKNLRGEQLHQKLAELLGE